MLCAAVEQKREYFRLEYPREVGPVAIFGEASYSVVNVSEYGVLLATDNIESFSFDEETAMQIVFHDRESYACRGKVVRIGNNKIAMSLTQPLPLHKIRSEHIFLISRFLNK